MHYPSSHLGKAKQSKNPITNGKVSSVWPHSHNYIIFQIAPKSDRYQPTSPNFTHPLASVKSLTKINLQGLGSFKAKLQQKIAHSRPASKFSSLHK